MHKACAMISILVVGTVSAGLSSCHGSSYTERSETVVSSDSGPVTISKMGGNIDVKDAPKGADLNTMGGDIHVGNAGSQVKAKTMGGGISIDHVDGSVDANTMGGVIKIGEATGAIKASSMGGDITAHVTGSSTQERDIELTSHGGTITLIVPKDFPMDVRITLAYTKTASRKFEIMDHVGLNQMETPDWDMSEGSPRKYIRAAGKVGSGLNHVTIKTINGDVFLKQE